MNKDEMIRLGDAAANLLQDEVVNLVLNRMESEYLEAWRNTKRTETEDRERLFLAVQSVTQFREHLKIMADNGTFERVQLERLRRDGNG
jgi:hypothetical protein